MERNVIKGKKKDQEIRGGVVLHTFSLNAQDEKAGGSPGDQDSLVY